jgi:peptide deformylase
MLVTSSSHNAEILHANTAPVVSGDEAVSIILALQEEMSRLSFCVGLAAPQIGISKSISIIRYNGVSINLINPTLISGERSFIYKNEGCMSFPSRKFDVSRFSTIRIKNDMLWPSPSGTVEVGKDPNKIVISPSNYPKNMYLVPTESVYVFENFEEEHGGVICIAIQHEIEHLSGITLDKKDDAVEKLSIGVDNKWKVGRNDPCPCGSGNKFKKCCWLKMS